MTHHLISSHLKDFDMAHFLIFPHLKNFDMAHFLICPHRKDFSMAMSRSTPVPLKWNVFLFKVQMIDVHVSFQLWWETVENMTAQWDDKRMTETGTVIQPFMHSFRLLAPLSSITCFESVEYKGHWAPLLLARPAAPSLALSLPRSPTCSVHLHYEINAHSSISCSFSP